MALFTPLSIGRSALLAHERAISTTGQNIANAETPGYRRQATELAPQDQSQGYGVRVVAVEQAVDRFLEAQLLRQESEGAAADLREQILDRVQDLFPVEEPSIRGSLDAFWVAAQRLADRPEDLAVRNDLIARAQELAARIRSVASHLGLQQRELDQRIAGEAGEANEVLQRIGALNQQIVAAEAGGRRANELRDQRDTAMLELAGYVEIQTRESANGAVDVHLDSSGLSLILGADVQEFVVDVGSTTGLDGNPLSSVGVQLRSGAIIDLPANPGGRIGGLVTLRDVDLADRAASLDAFALALRDAVNVVQTDPTATDLDGSVGTAMFSGAGAATLAVALTDPRGIAAAIGANSADNDNALALLDVREASQAGLSSATLTDFYGSLQAAVGSAARAAGDEATLASSVKSSLQGQREAVSGVSLEEEFTDLIRFQRGFQAAAQLISVSDGLLEDLIGLVRG